MEFKEIMKDLRKQRGLSQSDFAEFVGTSFTTYRRWEKGESTPNVNELKNLTLTLGVSADYLINGVNAPTAVSPIDNDNNANDTRMPPDPIPALSPEQKYDSHGCPRTQYWASVVDEALRISDNPQLYRHRNAAAIQDALYGLSRAQAIIRHIINTDPHCQHIKDDLDKPQQVTFAER